MIVLEAYVISEDMSIRETKVQVQASSGTAVKEILYSITQKWTRTSFSRYLIINIPPTAGNACTLGFMLCDQHGC